MSFADLVSEFTDVNARVKAGDATVEETRRWEELRRMLMQAQQRPVPNTDSKHIQISPLTPPTGVLGGS